MSFRTHNTNASTALANPFGAFSPARCFSRARPTSHMVRNSKTAAITMKITCFVGVRLNVNGPTWNSAQGQGCHFGWKKGNSNEYASAV